MATAIDMIPGQELVDALVHCWAEGETVLVLDQRLAEPIRDQLCKRLGMSRVIDDTGITHLSRTDVTEIYEPGDALVVATSGTTGEPKGVILTHDALQMSSRMTMDAIGPAPSDHWLCCIPPSHIGGLSVITRALHNSAGLTVLPNFDAEAVAEAARDGATLVSLVNTALRRVDASLFRKVLLGGSAPISNRPDNVISTYGMTETAGGVVYEGHPLEGVELRCDKTGQIWLRSPTLFRGYTNGTSPLDADGWFPTGDAGEVTDGTLSVFGRLTDVIITGGDKVWPVQIEAALKAHPLVSDALVFGEPDPEWDERVVAHIELLDPTGVTPSDSELRDLVKNLVAAFAAPKVIEVKSALTRTGSGKLVRPSHRGNRAG